MPGVDLPGVFEPRTLENAARLRDVLTSASSMVVVGAGWVCLEVAAVAPTPGVAVTVVEAGDQVLGRVASSDLADLVASVHVRHGVHFHLAG